MEEAGRSKSMPTQIVNNRSPTRFGFFEAGLLLIFATVSCSGLQTLASRKEGGKAINMAHTGRQISIEAAVSEAHVIVIAELLNAGRIHMGAPGQSYYDGAVIRVVETLAGKTTGDLTITYTRQTIPESIAEAQPREGGRYLFFLTVRSDGTWRAIKIDDASDENKARSIKALRTAPLGDRH